MIEPLNQNTVYSNPGNSSVLRFLDAKDRFILDVGCGSGDTGALIRSTFPTTNVTGITCSQPEYEIAKHRLNYCLCLNLEGNSFESLPYSEFDVLCFLHVLEHLVNPLAVIKHLLPYLKVGGKVVIALPNVANWRCRWKIAQGDFEYTDGGVMDRTHLHFYTYNTAPCALVDPIPQLKISHHSVNGSVPLGLLRHRLLTKNLRKRLDDVGCSWFPNLFGYEILIVAMKIS